MENSLLALYFSYKKATKFISDWLVSTVGPGQFRGSRLTTTEIVDAAKFVRERRLAVPGYLLDKFREVLVKRRAVHGLYVERSGSSYEKENLKHKAFIDRLEEAYQILLPLATLPHSLPLSTSWQKEKKIALTTNPFACLANLNLTDGPADWDENTQQDNTSGALELVPEKAEQVLQDDEIGEYIELSLFIYELDAICAKVNGYWSDVASGTLSIALAGFLTNTAYRAVERITQNYPGLPDNELLIHKFYFTKSDLKVRFPDIPELQQEYQRFSAHLGLWHYSRILNDCRMSDEYKEINPDAGRHQRPKDFIHHLTDSTESFSLDDLAMDTIQESMRQLLISGRAISALEEKPMRAEHLLPALDNALRDEKSPIPTYLIFGMEMLLSTYKSFLWSHPDINPAHCRFASLQFANGVIKSIEDCMPCLNRVCWCQIQDHCICSSRESVRDLQCKLKGYVQEKRFDLYYQAPWVAAGHIIEILHSSIYEGIYLCCENNYVTATLHLYNALRKVNPQIQRVAWLDQMCGIFNKSLFPGSIPDSNFSSAFRRSGGGRLQKTSRSHGLSRFQFSRGSPSLSRRPAACHRLSLLYSQHMMDYQPSRDLLTHLSEGRRIENPTPSQLGAAVRNFNSTPFPVTMDKIKDAVLPELQGDLPIARIDFFTVFRICIKILEDLCTPLDKDSEVSAQRGFELVDTLLEQISEHQRDGNLARLLPFLSLLKIAAIPFASLDKDKLLCEFAWNI